MAACAVLAAGVAGCGGGSTASPTASASMATPSTATTHSTTTTRSTTKTPARRTAAPYAVGIRTVTFTDPSRTVSIPGRGVAPRQLVTVIRYPARGPPGRLDVRDAPADRADGPFPLVIFGHGFAVTPTIYSRLLRAWAQAGYVVAAPVFPLENALAPGGPDESDLINQPRDMSFLITQLDVADTIAGGWLAHLLDPRAVAVSGQSDGGETALAVSYDRAFRDPRVRATVILSGAQIPGIDQLTFPPGGPPLLAAQGTADTINPPSFTAAFFGIAHRPKYLLQLLGAGHLPPYTSEDPQSGVVQRVTIAFLDRYLKHASAGIRRMVAAGDRAGTSSLTALP